MASSQVDNVPVTTIDVDANINEKKLDDSSASETASQELDGIHDGLEFPTDEETKTLRRVPDQVPWNAYCA